MDTNQKNITLFCCILDAFLEHIFRYIGVYVVQKGSLAHTSTNPKYSKKEKLARLIGQLSLI
jgi:hypothetical protein